MIWSAARQASPHSKAPLNGPFGSQRHDEMDLPRDLAEAASRIEVLPDRILVERLDSDVCQPELAEIVEGMVNQPPAHALPPQPRGHGEVGNLADARFAIDPRRHV